MGRSISTRPEHINPFCCVCPPLILKKMSAVKFVPGDALCCVLHGMAFLVTPPCQTLEVATLVSDMLETKRAWTAVLSLVPKNNYYVALVTSLLLPTNKRGKRLPPCRPVTSAQCCDSCYHKHCCTKLTLILLYNKLRRRIHTVWHYTTGTAVAQRMCIAGRCHRQSTCDTTSTHSDVFIVAPVPICTCAHSRVVCALYACAASYNETNGRQSA